MGGRSVGWMRTYEQEGCEHDHGNAYHMDDDVDGVLVVGAVLLQSLATIKLHQVKLSTHEAQLLLQVQRSSRHSGGSYG